MEWCIQCHRNPGEHLRPVDEVFSMIWKPDQRLNPETGRPYDQAALGRHLARDYHVRDAQVLTSCSTCHR